jgi:SNF2-related domain/Helicase conserved C-terminal domain
VLRSGAERGTRLRITWARERFEILDDKKWETYGAKETIRSAGGMWDGKVEIQYPWGVAKGAWYITPDRQRLEVLRSLKPTISKEAKAKFEELEAARLERIEASRATDASIDIPCNPGLAYLPYQRGGIAYACSHKDTLFGDEMGLGKSVEAVGAFNADASAKTALVICPASLKLNWQREWVKWDVKHSSIAIISPGQKQRPSADVVIINYDMLRKYREQLRKREWDMLIVDEAHYLKNGKTSRTKEVLGSKREKIEPLKAKRRLFLTGTPIVNRPKELWTLIEALSPEFEKSFMSYAMKYCDAHQTRFGWDFNGASRLDELQDRLRASFMVRRLKADVLKELPPKRRQVMVLESEGLENILEKEKQTYEDYKEAMKDGDFETPAFTEMSAVRKAVAVAKIPFVVSHIVETLAEVDKLVVFCHHREVAYTVAEEIDAAIKKSAGNKTRTMDGSSSGNAPQVSQPELGVSMPVRNNKNDKRIYAGQHLGYKLESERDEKLCVQKGTLDFCKELDSVAVITGETPNEDRQAAVDRFQTDPICKVFIGTIRAAGVGLTLTASSTVIFAELDWTPGNVTQAEDRCHRIGQADSVFIQHLVLSGSLDERMAQIIIDKQAVIDNALDTQTVPVASASFATEVAEQPATAPSLQREGEGAVGTGASVSPSPDRTYTVEQEQAALQCMRILAGMCDGAVEIDDRGFNKLHTNFGKSLASQSRFTEKQFKAAKQLANFYSRQLPQDLLNCLKIEKKRNKETQ